MPGTVAQWQLARPGGRLRRAGLPSRIMRRMNTDAMHVQPLAAEIRDWLVAHLARVVRRPAQDIEVTARFEQLGLDSATAVGVTLDLEDWLGRPVDPAIFYDYPTIQQLANALA